MVKWLFCSSVQGHEYASQKELNIREVSKSWRIYFTNVVTVNLRFNLSTIWDLKRDYRARAVFCIGMGHFKKWFLFVIMCTGKQVPAEPRRGCWIPWSWSYRWLWAGNQMWVFQSCSSLSTICQGPPRRRLLKKWNSVKCSLLTSTVGRKKQKIFLLSFLDKKKEESSSCLCHQCPINI